MIANCIGNSNFIAWIAFSLERIGSKLGQAKTVLQIFKACANNTHATNTLLNENPELPNALISMLNQTKSVNTLLETNLDIMYLISIQSKVLELIKPSSQIETIIELANEVPIVKYKKQCYKILSNMSSRPNLKRVIADFGMTEVVSQY